MDQKVGTRTEEEWTKHTDSQRKRVDHTTTNRQTLEEELFLLELKVTTQFGLHAGHLTMSHAVICVVVRSKWLIHRLNHHHHHLTPLT